MLMWLLLAMHVQCAGMSRLGWMNPRVANSRRVGFRVGGHYEDLDERKRRERWDHDKKRTDPGRLGDVAVGDEDEDITLEDIENQRNESGANSKHFFCSHPLIETHLLTTTLHEMNQING